MKSGIQHQGFPLNLFSVLCSTARRQEDGSGKFSFPPFLLAPSLLFFWLYYLVLHMYKQPKCCVRNEEIHPPIPHQSEPCPEKTRQSLTFNVVDQDRVIMKRIYCFLAEPYAQTGTTVSAETVSSSVL